jgi:hypothetical protein
MVTICNLNSFTTPFSQEILNDSYKYNESDSVKLNLFTQRYKAIVDSINLNNSVRKELGKTLNEFMFSCIFDWLDCNLIEDFQYTYDYEVFLLYN